jgi:hypothetical protein
MVNVGRLVSPAVREGTVMEKFRFFALIAVFAVVGFAAVRWLAPVGDSRLPTFHPVEIKNPEDKPPVADASNNDAARDKLRNAVIAAAADFAKDPCDTGNRIRYIEAASDYAHAWLAIAPCVATNTCNDTNGAQLDRVHLAFGTSLDHRVQEAMARAHAARTIKASDLPADIVSLMASLAADPSLMAEPPNGEQLRPTFGPLAHAGCTG